MYQAPLLYYFNFEIKNTRCIKQPISLCGATANAVDFLSGCPRVGHVTTSLSCSRIFFSLSSCQSSVEFVPLASAMATTRVVGLALFPLARREQQQQQQQPPVHLLPPRGSSSRALSKLFPRLLPFVFFSFFFLQLGVSMTSLRSVSWTDLRRSSACRPRPMGDPYLSSRCSSGPSAPTESDSVSPPVVSSDGRRWILGSSLAAAAG